MRAICLPPAALASALVVSSAEPAPITYSLPLLSSINIVCNYSLAHFSAHRRANSCVSIAAANVAVLNIDLPVLKLREVSIFFPL